MQVSLGGITVLDNPNLTGAIDAQTTLTGALGIVSAQVIDLSASITSPSNVTGSISLVSDQVSNLSASISSPSVISGVISVDAAPSAPLVISQPVSRTVIEGATIAFSTTISNASSIQWYRNGVIIAGANSSTYQPATALANSGDTFYAIATGENSLTVQTNTVTLTVNPVSGSGLIFDRAADWEGSKVAEIVVGDTFRQLVTLSANGQALDASQAIIHACIVEHDHSRRLCDVVDVALDANAGAGMVTVLFSGAVTGQLARAVTKEMFVKVEIQLELNGEKYTWFATARAYPGYIA